MLFPTQSGFCVEKAGVNGLITEIVFSNGADEQPIVLCMLNLTL
jgi:hypothetical protein